MITQNQYERLKTEFGDVASWAIWMAQKPDGKAKSNISDLSIFDSKDILELLNPNFVLVGLNASVHELPETKPWMSFHSADVRRSQDYKLRDVLLGTPLWGSYITDIIKNYPEKLSGKLRNCIKRNPEILVDNIKVFRQELEILGTKPTLIALGNDSYDLLAQTTLCEQFTIKRITHYAATIAKQSYKDEVEKLLDDLN